MDTGSDLDGRCRPALRDPKKKESEAGGPRSICLEYPFTFCAPGRVVDGTICGASPDSDTALIYCHEWCFALCVSRNGGQLIHSRCCRSDPAECPGRRIKLVLFLSGLRSNGGSDVFTGRRRTDNTQFALTPPLRRVVRADHLWRNPSSFCTGHIARWNQAVCPLFDFPYISSYAKHRKPV